MSLKQTVNQRFEKLDNSQPIGAALEIIALSEASRNINSTKYIINILKYDELAKSLGARVTYIDAAESDGEVVRGIQFSSPYGLKTVLLNMTLPKDYVVIL